MTPRLPEAETEAQRGRRPSVPEALGAGAAAGWSCVLLPQNSPRKSPQNMPRAMGNTEMALGLQRKPQTKFTGMF